MAEDITQWSLDNLVELYVHQIKNNGNTNYIKVVGNLIKEKYHPDKVTASGMASEYRNERRHKIEFIRSIIKATDLDEVLTLEREAGTGRWLIPSTYNYGVTK